MEDKIEKMVITSRGYELASNGVLPMATYLRYLEHIRWTTIATSDKLPLRQFWQMGVVRSQVVEIYDQTSFGATLELTMWLARVGRSSMDFSHDIIRVADGTLVGRSTATIVALDHERRPAIIGEGARAYIVDRAGISPDRFEGEPPPSAWSRGIELRPSDHDLQQHVNHARYAELVDDTRLLCADAGGYGSTGDWTRPARRFSIAYEQEARVGDAVVGKTWPTPGKSMSADFALSKDAGAIVTRARIEL